MTKNIWIGLVALVLVVACGVAEFVVLGNEFKALSTQCDKMIQNCQQNNVTTTDYDKFSQHWHNLREKGELFLPHVDLYEINLRFAEAQAYVEQGDYNQLLAQLRVIQELLDYVPHLMTPTFEHLM